MCHPSRKLWPSRKILVFPTVLARFFRRSIFSADSFLADRLSCLYHDCQAGIPLASFLVVLPPAFALPVVTQSWLGCCSRAHLHLCMTSARIYFHLLTLSFLEVWWFQGLVGMVWSCQQKHYHQICLVSFKTQTFLHAEILPFLSKEFKLRFRVLHHPKFFA